MQKRIYYLADIDYDLQHISAALNRIKSFNKGLEYNGISSEIILVNKKKYKSTIYKKVHSYIFVFFQLLKMKKGCSVIMYGVMPYCIFIPLFKHKLKFYSERNEYPSFLINQHGVSKFERKKEEFYLKNMKLFNGLITCSYALSDYYGSFLKNKTNIFISPLIVDINKFNNINSRSTIIEHSNYLAYVGRLGNNKDGVPILIKAFSIFAKHIKDVNLVIIGNASAGIEKELHDLVSSLNIEKRIIFTGALIHKDIIPILQNAKLLLLARPNNKQAEGGIPSKIGEYMAVNVPMVITKVGELNRFLTDMENCFFATPDSTELFAEKMIEAYEFKDKQKITNNAFKTVKQFDINIQAKLLFEFLNQ